MLLETLQASDQQGLTYLVGVGVSHSIAPPMHNFIAKSLGFHWNFIAKECPTIEDAVKTFREPSFVGGVVTMPYKVSIMPHLDGLDEHATLLKACNNVYRAPDGSLRGTNTDWRGIKGCLESVTTPGTCTEGLGKPALLIGAGGAARAALYVLHHEFRCTPIYLVNRDRSEVDVLLKDAEVYGGSSKVNIIHLDSINQARKAEQSHGAPYYAVGTVPDFEPQTLTEIEARAIVEYMFQSASLELGSKRKGVFLDMCFKPRRTRTIKLAESYNWTTVDGTGVIGHQIEEQYRLWAGCEVQASSTVVTEEVRKGAWEVLNKTAADSKLINF